MRRVSPDLKNQRSPNSASLSQKTSPRSVSANKNLQKNPEKKQRIDSQQIIDKLRNNRLKICHTLDTYVLLISSNTPIRCLQHNSNISLYCQTQQRLICSNCIFSTLHHKLHKVIPVEKSFIKIQKDIQSMQKLIDKEVYLFEQDYQKYFNHYKQESEYAQNFIVQIQNFYQKARIFLDQCEMNSKKKLFAQLQEQQIKYQTFLNQLCLLRDIYKEKNKNVKSSNYKDTNIQLYDHTILYTMLNKVKFTHKYWNIQNYQIQKYGMYEIKKVNFILEVLQKMFTQK